METIETILATTTNDWHRFVAWLKLQSVLKLVVLALFTVLSVVAIGYMAMLIMTVYAYVLYRVLTSNGPDDEMPA